VLIAGLAAGISLENAGSIPISSTRRGATASESYLSEASDSVIRQFWLEPSSGKSYWSEETFRIFELTGDHA